MKLDQPRITPLKKSDWTAEQKAVFESYFESHREVGNFYNVLGTLSRHWEAFKKFSLWSNHILGSSLTLSVRDRELLILRTGWLCEAEYEWGQHVKIAKNAEITDTEIERIKKGSEENGWSLLDATLLRAADELHYQSFIKEETWKTLQTHYSVEQLMDIIFTVGQYTLVSMFLNTCGVQLDEGVKGF